MLNPITFLFGMASGYWLCKFLSRGKTGDAPQSHDENTKHADRTSTQSYPDKPFDMRCSDVQNPIILPEITSSDFGQDSAGSENTPALNKVEEKSDDVGDDKDGHESRLDAFKESGGVKESLKPETDKLEQNEESEQSDLVLSLKMPARLDNEGEVEKSIGFNCRKENKAVSGFLDSLYRFVDSLDSADNGFVEYLKNELSTVIVDFAEKRFSTSEKDAENEDSKIWLEMAKRIGSFLEELDSLLLKGDSEAAVIRGTIGDIGRIIMANGAEVIDVDTGFDSLRHRNVESDFVPTGTEISETVSPGFVANGQVVKRALVRVNHRREKSNE